MLKRRAGAVTLFLTAALFAVVAIQSDQREAALFFWVLAALFAVSGLLSSRRPSWLTKWRSHVQRRRRPDPDEQIANTLV